MRRYYFLAIIFLLLALTAVGVVSAAPPPDSPPGLQRAIEVKERHEKAILVVAGVAGIAVGLNDTSKPTILVFTETPGVRGLPAALEDVPVVVHVSGKVVALPKGGNGNGKPGTQIDPTGRFDRPVPIGVSTGHPAITAGTIGARVKGTSGNVYALSNNHVYANENNSTLGDAVIQPGTYDGGSSPADDIGTLSDFEPINFTGGGNVIDAAIALSSTTQLGNATPSDGYGTPRSATAAPSINMKVKKYGRTTGFTKGQISAIDGTFWVGYGSGTALFVNQIVIQQGGFSGPGDSGSLIVGDAKGKNNSDDRRPVGLLFAGSPSLTLANPITAVLDRFGVSIDGD